MSSSRKRSRDNFDANDKSSALSEPNPKRQKMSTHNNHNNKNDAKTEQKDDDGLSLDEPSNISQNDPLTLNVGGTKYMTTIQTLTGYQSMLKAWFSGNYKIKPSSDGTFFIDRNSKLFEYILEYLRNGSLIFPSNWDKTDIWRFYIEVKYFMIESLFDTVLLKLFNSELIRNNLFKMQIINKINNSFDTKIDMEKLRHWMLRIKYDTFDAKYSHKDYLKHTMKTIEQLHDSTQYSLLLIECDSKIYGLFLSTTEHSILCCKSFAFNFHFNSYNVQLDCQQNDIDFQNVRAATDDETQDQTMFCDNYPILIRKERSGCLGLKITDEDREEWTTIIKMEFWSLCL